MSKHDNTLNFSEILDEQIEKSFANASDFSGGWSSPYDQTLDPMYLSYLLGSLDIEVVPTVSKAKNPYLKYKKIIIIQDHSLSIAEQKAFDFINLYLNVDTLLLKNFNLTQLKRSYKKAALRAHPDLGGSHDQFLQLKSSYEMLLAFLKPIK